MFCTNCGSAIPEGAKFCTNCGATVAPAAAETAQTENFEEPVQEAVNDTAEQAADNSQIPEEAAGAAAAVPEAPKPQGTWYDQPYAMSQNQVNEGNFNQQQQQQPFDSDPAESVKNPSFGDAIRSFFTRYVDFKGRSSRAEYWYIVLLSFLVSTVFGILIGATDSGIFKTIQGLYSFLVFIPSLAIWFRRLHDTGRSGWFILIMLIPIVGWILNLIWLCSASDGGNIYGPEPKMK